METLKMLAEIIIEDWRYWVGVLIGLFLGSILILILNHLNK